MIERANRLQRISVLSLVLFSMHELESIAVEDWPFYCFLLMPSIIVKRKTGFGKYSSNIVTKLHFLEFSLTLNKHLFDFALSTL